MPAETPARLAFRSRCVFKGAGDLPENTEETETTLKTEITRGNMQLEICLKKINGSYEIAKWRCTARWQPDDSLNLG